MAGFIKPGTVVSNPVFDNKGAIRQDDYFSDRKFKGHGKHKLPGGMFKGKKDRDDKRGFGKKDKDRRGHGKKDKDNWRGFGKKGNNNNNNNNNWRGLGVQPQTKDYPSIRIIQGRTHIGGVKGDDRGYPKVRTVDKTRIKVDYPDTKTIWGKKPVKNMGGYPSDRKTVTLDLRHTDSRKMVDKVKKKGKKKGRKFLLKRGRGGRGSVIKSDSKVYNGPFFDAPLGLDSYMWHDIPPFFANIPPFAHGHMPMPFAIEPIPIHGAVMKPPIPFILR